MRLPKLGDIVLVKWSDIQVDYGWTQPDAQLGAAPCMTVGIVIEVTDLLLTVAACVGSGNCDEETEVNLRMALPTGCITSWAPLRKGRVVK